MNRHPIVARLLAAALVLFIFPTVRPVAAAPMASFTVNSTQDRPDDQPGDGMCHASDITCTLRAAIMEANRGSGTGATIYLPAGVYLLIIPVPGGNLDNSGDLNFTDPPVGTNPVISLVATGEAVTIVDANQLDRAFRIADTREAGSSNLTIRNGFASQAASWGSSGGGILTTGYLYLERVTIRDNRAFNAGGLIGDLTMTQTTVSGNTEKYGSGIYLPEGQACK